MNATLPLERPGSVAAPRLGAGAAIRLWLTALRVVVGRLSRRQQALAVAVLTGALVIVASVAQGARLTGYLGVFGFSILANAILFLPSGRGAIMVAGALVLNPLAVAVLTGVGGAIGEITGYALGRSSRSVVKTGMVPAWLERSAKRHMAVGILAISIIPNPFVDAVGIIAGRVGYPLRLFLVD